MANKFLGFLCLFGLTTSSLAGLASTYSYSPYTTYHVPSAAAAVYQQQSVAYQPQPVAYHAVSPYFARSLVAAAPAPIAAPAAAAIVKSVDYDSEPRYDFSYGVHDSVTGDIKNQVESRNGGNVAGSYSVVDADGYKRTVTYTADDLNGFNAVVQREPIVGVAAPVVAAAPVQQQVAFLPSHQYLPQAPAVAVQPQPALDPLPIDYPQQPQQPDPQQYPQDPQFPPFSQQDPNNINNAVDDDDDSEIVEVRSASKNASPTPISENQPNSIPSKRTA